MRRDFCLSAAVVGVLVVGAGSAQAALVIGNMNQPFGSVTALSFPERRAASSFSLGAGFTPNELLSVTLKVGSSTAGTGADAYLCYDDAGKPGATAVSLGSVIVPQTFNGVTFTPQSFFLLQPSTKYWVVLSHQATGADLQWVQNASTTADAGSNPAASLQNPSGSMLSFNFGSTWSAHNSQTFHFAVHAVPTPGTAAVIGVVGMMGMGRRRR